MKGIEGDGKGGTNVGFFATYFGFGVDRGVHCFLFDGWVDSYCEGRDERN